ncbi:MAG: sugar ABC transporter permease YjfF [Propionivibrio sp.]|uniref:galactofuranose ABC transporter, permease protein YjfF n=1 Tax=Propionivibrio sp. TaxID=2212460 RepID=UPI001B431653|nr:galactofuranose ABC transporter, permease protein YjfF [Propionivibrio sp.]MBP7204371.1 sugar ABC transporter permease YjfF [Propionivibrio sp.]
MNFSRFVNPRSLPLVITSMLFALLYGFGALSYDAFLSPQVFVNLLIDNGFLLVVAVGMTFVIISGGIDLSVGSIVALTTMISATLAQKYGWTFWQILPLVLAIGCLFGLFMGVLIQIFKLQAFIVTLGGMFLARGLCYVISIDSISITEPSFTVLSEYRMVLGEETFISAGALVAVVILLIGIYIAHFTRFGRTVYAIGGNERSAMLMGLPVGRTKIMVYVLSGFCSALGGVLVTLYMLSGYGLHALGFEMDAIAAAVIGGTLLTGGVGYLAGTLVGVLILGVIQTLIAFDGELSSWWTRIGIGALLFVFCLMQRMLERSSKKIQAKS